MTLKKIRIGLLLAGLAAGVTAGPTQATDDVLFGNERSKHRRDASERSFQRVGTLANYVQYDENAGDETISEIISATADGKTLVYTDAVRH